MNFDMASEILEIEGIKTAVVKVSADIASASRQEYKKRRGEAGRIERNQPIRERHLLQRHRIGGSDVNIQFRRNMAAAG